MIFKLIARIQFLFTSTNQHGVHSPFVFDFVAKGLYQKSAIFEQHKIHITAKNLSKKELKILQKIGDYFEVEHVYTHPKELENSLENDYKILFINDIENFYLNDSFSAMPNLCLAFYGIYANPKTQQLWKSICKNKQATVTIDLYYFGLVVFRKEQEKEHFKIRV